MKKFGLSAFWLKIFAMTAMLIDHIGAVLLSSAFHTGMQTQTISPSFFTFYSALRNIGRAAFPVFAFLLVQGFLHTSNYKKYLTRMGILALISIIPYNLAFGNMLYNTKYWQNFTFGNVAWTYLLGLVMMYLLAHIERKDWHLLCRLLGYILVVGIFMGIAYFIHCDRRHWGILVIAGFHLCRDSQLKQVLSSCITFRDQRGFFPGPDLALIPIVLYNGKKGRDIRVLAYLFYPLHLLILYGIKVYFPI